MGTKAASGKVYKGRVGFSVKPLGNHAAGIKPSLCGYNQDMTFKMPARVAANCHRTPEGAAWLDRLPEVLSRVARRWSLAIRAPFDNDEHTSELQSPKDLV